MKKHNNGSIFEGLRTEIGGLIQQDTGGLIEFIRNKITNARDGGVDSTNSVSDKIDYFDYIRKLKEKK